MKITDNQNFCRVFILPNSYPGGFLFQPKTVAMAMVDWFSPIPPKGFNTLLDKASWEEIKYSLFDSTLKHKNYVVPGNTYLLITAFGKAFMFNSERVLGESDKDGPVNYAPSLRKSY